MPRALLITNNRASTVDDDRESRVVTQLRSGVDLDVARTTKRGDATRFAREAARDGLDVVFCLGGDGTANETARGLMHTATALAPLPGGSTNVFSRSLGFPRDPEQAAAVAVRCVVGRPFVSMSVGEVEVTDTGPTQADLDVDDRFDQHGRRPFLFHCGAGFDAQVTERVESTPHLKRRFGHLFFAAAAASTWISRDRAAIAVECVFADDREGSPIENTKFAVVSNSDPYSFLASRPLAIAPEASPLSGPLVATAATTLSPLAAIRILAGALGSKSSVADAPGVVQHANVTEIRWRSDTPFAIQVDGEPLGRATDVRLRQKSAALQIVRPPT